MQHADDRAALRAPALRLPVLDIPKVDPIAAPQTNLLRRADRHRQIAPELPRRALLPPGPLGHQRTHGFRGPSELIGQAAELFDPWKVEAGTMKLKRQPISPPEDLKILHV